MPQSSEVPTLAPTAGPTTSIAEHATIPADRAPWFSRIKEAATLHDPKATVAYIVARDGANLPTGDVEPETLRRVRDDFRPGIVLQERYRLIRELGRGGMGVVFLGRDQRLDRHVALKVILTSGQTSNPAASADSKLRASFAEEARLGASLTHPAVATVFDYGFHHENPFTVFEYIEGETLRELLERRGRLPLDEVRLIIGPLAQALDFAHGRRIVHRDLKPENIRATEQRQFKILDLGLAREFNRQDDWRFAGTPAYAAPEQAAELPSDGRADQYALGVIVFEMLAGRRPFESESWVELLRMHSYELPPKPRSLVPDLPQSVEDAILRSLEKDPNRRFSTCSELAVALGCQFLAGPVAPPEILLETEVKKTGGRWKSYFYPFSFFWRPRTHLALAPDALWAMFRTELMRWPMHALYDMEIGRRRRLSFRIRGVKSKDTQWFQFKNRRELSNWRQALEPRIVTGQQVAQAVAGPPALEGSQDTGQDDLQAGWTVDPRTEPVVLLKRRPGSRFQLLGMAEAKAQSRRSAAAGLAIRRSMMGADAIGDLHQERLPGLFKTEHRASGMAVRAVDEEGRIEIKTRWFSGQIGQVAIVMLVVEALDLLSNLVAVSERHSLLVTLNAIAAILFASLVAGLAFFKWPQLVRPAAFGFLAKGIDNVLRPIGTALGSLVVGLGAYATIPSLALQETTRAAMLIGAAFGGATVLALTLLFMVSLCVFFLYLARRAWRIDQEHRNMVGEAPGTKRVPVARRRVGRLAWGAAVIYALLLGSDSVANLYASARELWALPSAISMGSVERQFFDPSAEYWNTRAWALATDPDPAARDAAEAVRLAEQAVEAEPNVANYANTLGVARYRAGNLLGSIGALKRSMAGQGFNAGDAFFLAMAHARLGPHDEAREWYTKADRWMRQNQSIDSELQRFRAESATVLELTGERALAHGEFQSETAAGKKETPARSGQRVRPKRNDLPKSQERGRDAATF